MRWLIALLVLDALALALIVTDAAEPQRADLVFAATSEHNFIDPQRLSASNDVRLAENLFEPLLRVNVADATLPVEPATAKAMPEVSEDQRTYTFTIRDDARWSNGDPVKASDFVYAWRRALMPDFAADYSYFLWRLEGAKAFFDWRQQQLTDYALKPQEAGPEKAEQMLKEAYERFDQTVGVKALDDKTLRVTLESPTTYFPHLCAWITYTPVHEASVEKFVTLEPKSGALVQGALWTRPGNLISNGPYQLERRRFRRDLLLTQNPYYWNKDAMRNKSILELIVPGAQTQLLLYEAGHVDWLPDIPSNDNIARDLHEQGRADAHLPTAVGTYYYNFNCENETLADGSPNPFLDVRVRRAFALAIDRKQIVEKVNRAGQQAAHTFVPPGTNAAYPRPTEVGLSFDPDEARRLLAEAGYPGGKGLPGIELLYNTGANHELAGQAIAHTWEKELGVSVPLRGKEWPVFQEDRKSHFFTVARGGWIGDYPDPTTFLDLFHSQSNHNDAGYNNPEVDALLEAASKETDPTKRLKLLRDVETIVLRDVPVAPIYYYNWFHLFDPKRVRNMHLNPWNFRRLEFVEVTDGPEERDQTPP